MGSSSFLERIRAVVISLIDRQFPIRSFMLLESSFPPFVRDIIRYIPHLFHLRSAPWYGQGYHPRCADDLDRFPDHPRELRSILSSKIQMIMDDVDLYICFDSISTDRQIDVRNLWSPAHTDPLAQVPRRPDLQVCFDLRKLDEYLSYMRKNYDIRQTINQAHGTDHTSILGSDHRIFCISRSGNRCASIQGPILVS